jgi:hypothetical protein
VKWEAACGVGNSKDAWPLSKEPAGEGLTARHWAAWKPKRHKTVIGSSDTSVTTDVVYGRRQPMAKRKKKAAKSRKTAKRRAQRRTAPKRKTTAKRTTAKRRTSAKRRAGAKRSTSAKRRTTAHRRSSSKRRTTAQHRNVATRQPQHARSNSKEQEVLVDEALSQSLETEKPSSAE